MYNENKKYTIRHHSPIRKNCDSTNNSKQYEFRDHSPIRKRSMDDYTNTDNSTNTDKSTTQIEYNGFVQIPFPCIIPCVSPSYQHSVSVSAFVQPTGIIY